MWYANCLCGAFFRCYPMALLGLTRDCVGPDADLCRHCRNAAERERLRSQLGEKLLAAMAKEVCGPFRPSRALRGTP